MKKERNKLLLCRLLFVLLALFCLSSCAVPSAPQADGKETDVTCNNTAGESVTDFPPTDVTEDAEPLILGADGVSDYVISYPRGNSTLDTLSYRLMWRIREKTGIALSRVYSDKVNAKQIILLHEPAHSTTAKDDVFEIRAEDGTLHLLGNSAEALSYAVDYFSEIYVSMQEGSFFVPTPLTVAGNSTESLSPIAEGEQARYSVATESGDALADSLAHRLVFAIRAHTGATPSRVYFDRLTPQRAVYIHSVASEDTLDKNEICIKSIEESIHVSGGSEEALQLAVDYLILTYMQTEEPAAFPTTVYIKKSIDEIEIPKEEITMTIKTASFNIANGREVGHDFTVLAKDILDSGAEIIALQEVDMFTSRNGNQDTLKALSDATGFAHYVFAPTLRSYRGGQYGIAFLSKYPIVAHEAVDLPMLSSDEEQRAVLHVTVSVNGYLLEFFNTHGQQVSIRQQLSKINEYTSQHESFVLAGDFNTAKYENFDLIENTYTVNNYDNPMITTVNNHSFDNYVITHDIVAENIRLIDTGHSDHKMLCVDLTVTYEK